MGTYRPLKCERCENSYHTSCWKLISVAAKDNVIFKACYACVAAENPVSSLSRSNSFGSNSSLNDLRMSGPTTSTSTQTSQSLLDKIDAIANTVNSTSSHVTSIDSRVTSIDNKKLRDMADRLLVAENEIQDAKADVAAVNTELVTAKAKTLRRFEVLEQQQDSLQ